MSASYSNFVSATAVAAALVAFLAGATDPARAQASARCAWAVNRPARQVALMRPGSRPGWESYTAIPAWARGYALVRGNCAMGIVRPS